MGGKIFLFSLVLILLSFNVVFAEEFGYNLLEPGEDLNPGTNFSIQNVNSSEFWRTNEGLKDNVADILLSELGNKDHDVLDNLLWSQAGHTIDITFDFNNNNFINVFNGTIKDKLFLTDTNHWIKKGADGFDGLSTSAIALQHKDEEGGGEIVFIVTSNKTNSDVDSVNIMAQSGRNNSAGVLGNSWMIIPNNLTNNLTIYSDCFLVANLLGKTLRVQCDTPDTGSDLIIHDDIQAFGTGFFDGGIRAETLADFIMNGNSFDIQNGSLHIFSPVTFTSGVTQGDSVTTFQESFTGGIGSFLNLQDDFGNWFATSDVLCDDGDCAESIGISGVGNIIIEANISTTNINDTFISFVYSLVNMLGSNDFTVTANNNVGSGEVTLLTDSTNNVIKSSESISMPSSMWNQPKVSLRFECDVTQPNRECFVDTIKVNGTAIATTATAQSGFNSEICFSDGTTDSDGVCNVGVFYNASLNQVFPKGNWNLSGASGFPTDHSALTNLVFGSAGHTGNLNLPTFNTTWDKGTFTTLNVTGNAFIGELTWNGNLLGGNNNQSNWNFISAVNGNFSGNITADTYFGDGSQLTGVVHSVNDTIINITGLIVKNIFSDLIPIPSNENINLGMNNFPGGSYNNSYIKRMYVGTNAYIEGTSSNTLLINATNIQTQGSFTPSISGVYSLGNLVFKYLDGRFTGTVFAGSFSGSWLGSMVPLNDLTDTLGTASKHWAELYIADDGFLGDGIFIGTGQDVLLSYDGSNPVFRVNSGNSTFIFKNQTSPGEYANLLAKNYFQGTPDLRGINLEDRTIISLVNNVEDMIDETGHGIKREYLLPVEKSIIPVTNESSCVYVNFVWCYDGECLDKDPKNETYIMNADKECDTISQEVVELGGIGLVNKLDIAKLNQENQMLKDCIATSKDFIEVKNCIAGI